MNFSKKHPTLCVAVCAALVIVVASLVALVVRANKSEVVDVREVITYSTDSPDEEKPNDSYVWRGLPTDPKYIDMPSINASGYVQSVGKDQYSAVAVPNNIHMGGWFVDMALPGQPGLSIIDGHVTGRKND